MTFLNNAVTIDSLPQAEDVQLEGVNPAYRKILRLEWMITTLVLALVSAALIYFLPGLRNSYGWVLVTAAFLLLTGWYFLAMERSFPYLSFAIREHDVMLQRGWIIRRLKVCPFNRTQNCTIKRGPLERRFGLATLIIFTAGSDGADMSIPGLNKAEAHRIRKFILSRIHEEGHEQL